MLKLTLGEASSPYRVLAVGCHADDIEIGCGGTILHLIESLPSVEVWWVVLRARDARAEEVHRSAEAFLDGAAGRRIIVSEFRDGFFPYDGGAIKDFFEDLKPQISPDLIFTHNRKDLHQDHRVASELTWNTFRNHLILEYEVPKYDGDFGTPNVFFHLTEAIAKRKVENLLEFFQTQRDRRWFTDDLFLSALRIRGMESNSPTRYAEGFYGRKVVL
ncbi:MAG TPA: PIG-L deacetylase family protein [Gemmatimonadaceae bacterium]|nr:PIG-L deacetylase family protein [Gemmatimonadaceae bacterium]